MSKTGTGPIPNHREEWSREREHIENVLMERFNFFIVFFGIIIAGAFAADSPAYASALLGVGGFICFQIARTISRAQDKFDIVFGHILTKYRTHPASKSDLFAGGNSRRRLIGKTIPRFCVAFLATAFLASILVRVDGDRWRDLLTQASSIAYMGTPHSQIAPAPITSIANTPAIASTSPAADSAASRSSSWELGLALASVIAALGAWWISWNEARRNNNVRIRLRRFSSYIRSDSAGRHHVLEICIENMGIQLQDLSVSLQCLGAGRSGVFSVPLFVTKPSAKVSVPFLRGTIAKFLLTTADRDSGFLSTLGDLCDHEPSLCISNGEFEACRIPICKRTDAIKRRWNSFAFPWRTYRRIGDGVEGRGVFKLIQLPLFTIMSEQLLVFVNGVREFAMETPGKPDSLCSETPNSDNSISD